MKQTTMLAFETGGVSNDNDEWYTPSWLFEALGVEFDLDPCSPGAPPSSVPAKRHLTKADNGLAADWSGSVWLNPPFSSKTEWYSKLVAHGDGIGLMPNRTETHDTQEFMHAATALLFLKGRIYFERGSRPGWNGMNGVHTTPPFGIVLCAYGETLARALLDSKLMGLRVSTLPSFSTGKPGEMIMAIPQRHNQEWTRNDVVRMRALAKEKKSARQAARELGRSTGAVKYKAMVEGVRFHFINQPEGVQRRLARANRRRR